MALVLTLIAIPAVNAGSLVLPDAQLALDGERNVASLLLASVRGDEFSLDGVRVSLNVKRARVFVEASQIEDQKDGIAFRNTVDLDGNSFGAGVSAPILASQSRFGLSLRLSLHRATLDVSSPIAVAGRQATANIERSSFTAGFRINPSKTLNRYGLNAVAGMGLRLRQDKRSVSVDRNREPRLDDDDTKLDFSAMFGITQRIGFAQIFLVAEEADGFSAMIGLQLELQHRR